MHFYEAWKTSLDRVAAPACPGSYSPIGIHLRVLLQDIFPSLYHVDEWLATPVFGNSVREFYHKLYFC